MLGDRYTIPNFTITLFGKPNLKEEPTQGMLIGFFQF